MENLDLGDIVEGRFKVNKQGPKFLRLVPEQFLGLPNSFHVPKDVNFATYFLSETSLGRVEFIYIIFVDE